MNVLFDHLSLLILLYLMYKFYHVYAPSWVTIYETDKFKQPWIKGTEKIVVVLNLYRLSFFRLFPKLQNKTAIYTAFAL